MAISVSTLFEALGYPLDQPMIDHLVDLRRQKMLQTKADNQCVQPPPPSSMEIPPCPTCHLEVSVGEWIGGLHLFCGSRI